MLNHFIGYGSIETWAIHASTLKTVYADALIQPGRTSKQGLRQDKLAVHISQIDGDGNIHYCSLPCGYLAYVAGHAFDSDHTERQQRQQQVFHLVLDWLKEHGFSVRMAIIATPKNLTFMDGWAEFIQYDQETKTFYRSDLKDEAGEKNL